MDRLMARLQEEHGALRVSELAEVLQCSRSYVYKCIKAEALKAGRVGSDYRIPIQEARRLAVLAGLLDPGCGEKPPLP
jgi:excisionase family DNA binding protein